MFLLMTVFSSRLQYPGRTIPDQTEYRCLEDTFPAAVNHTTGIAQIYLRSEETIFPLELEHCHHVRCFQYCPGPGNVLNLYGAICYDSVYLDGQHVGSSSLDGNERECTQSWKE